MTNDLARRLREDEITVTLCHIAAARIEELEKQLAEEKKYFEEVNERAWDVHSRVRQLENQLDISNEALHAAITVKHTQEWNAHFKEVMTETKNVLRGNI